MNKPKLIVIAGQPGSGKTTLGKKIAAELNVPMFSRDGFKETLFESLGWEDREWSKKLGQASYRLLDYVITAELESGQSLIVESNFSPKFDTEKFLNWHDKYSVQFLQIVCKADPDTLFERFKKRAESGERHPGHGDINNLEEFRAQFNNEVPSLDIPGEVIIVDTNDYAKIDTQKIINNTKRFAES